MKTFTIHAHMKPISSIKFSKEGDLVFIACKDHTCSVWYTETGEMLGSYKCGGSINQISVNSACTRLLAACGDYKLYIFDVKTGENISCIDEGAPVLGVSFSLEGNQFFTLCKGFVGQKSKLKIYDATKDNKKIKEIYDDDTMPNVNMTSAVWGPLNETIVIGYSDGTLTLFDVATGSVLKKVKAHEFNIKQIQTNARNDIMITASEDKSACLFNMRTLEKVKEYRLPEIVNTAAISPLKRHVLLGGGQASTATTTGKKETFNAVHFFHTIFEKEIGSIKAHFSPVNAIAIAPDGKSFISGGEDGIVKLFPFDKDYLNMRDDSQSTLKF